MMGHDPITGDPLGLESPFYKTPAERIEARIADLNPALSPGRKGEVVAQIVADETARGTRRARFDFRLSIPKSANVLWAEADQLRSLPISDAVQRIDATRTEQKLLRQQAAQRARQLHDPSERDNPRRNLGGDRPGTRL